MTTVNTLSDLRGKRIYFFDNVPDSRRRALGPRLEVRDLAQPAPYSV
jgi:hypothetical protein